MSFRLAVLTLSSTVLFGAPAFAGSAKDEECAAGAKVASLIAGWKSAAQQAEAMGPAEKERLTAEIAAVAAKCPVGSRVGVTFAAVRDSLALVVASEEECAKHCPLEKAASGGADAAACAAGKELKTARSKALRGLHELASHAAAFTGAGCCAAKACDKPAAGKAAQVEKCAKDESCVSAAASCPVRTASRIGMLKASWETARGEATTLAAAKKKEIRTGFGSLSGRSKAVALVPETALALAEGLDALHALHGQMQAWAESNPEILRATPEEGMRAFRIQVALLDETRTLLNRVKETMTCMQSGDGEAVETARQN